MQYRIFQKIRIYIFLFLIPVFWGCDAVHDDAYVYTKNLDYVYISLNLESDSQAKVVSTARTIKADEIDLRDSSYHYYIWGKSSKDTVSPKEVTFSPTSEYEGTIPLDFPISTYYFTLAAVKGIPSSLTDSSTILNEAVLVAYSGVDLSYTNTVKFYLSTKGLQSYGKLNLSFTLDDTWSSAEITDLTSNYRVWGGLYEIDSGEPVSSVPSFELANLSDSSLISVDTYSAIAGTYNLVVTMQKNGESVKYTYSDTIIVTPNRVITATVKLPNVIEYAPTAPSDFKAAYCLDERIYSSLKNSDGNSIEDDIDYTTTNEYAVLFSWSDNSNNETNFKLTLADVSKIQTMPTIPATMTDTAWGSIVNAYAGNSSVVKVYDADCKYGQNYFAGSLDKNSSSLILYVPFGACYIAKLEAVNASGTSSACYVTLDEDFNIGIYDENYGNNTAIYSGKAFSAVQNPCNLINLYKVVYHFSGGTLEYTKDAVLKQVEGSLVDYGVYGTYSFLCPITDVASATESSPALVYLYTGTDAVASYGSRWTHWNIDSYLGTNLINTTIGGTTIVVDANYSYQKPNDYTGYTSLYLFARYD